MWAAQSQAISLVPIPLNLKVSAVGSLFLIEATVVQQYWILSY